MKKFIIIIASCLLFGAHFEKKETCLGDNQNSDVLRYYCVNPNAYVGTTFISEIDNGSSVAAKLYYIDGESVLSATPAKYVLAISSFDIGEPVILLGLQADYLMSFKVLSKGTPFIFKLVNSNGQPIKFLIEISNYNSIKVNGSFF